MTFFTRKRNAAESGGAEPGAEVSDAVARGISPEAEKPSRLKRLFARKKHAPAEVTVLESGDLPSVSSDEHVALTEPAGALTVAEDFEAEEPSARTGFFARMKDAFKRDSRATEPDAVPISVLIGYFPEISKRDAEEYAQGIADKHFQQPGIVFYDAFPFDNGFVYEVHEGGSGQAFAPSVLKYFRNQGPFRPGEQVSVVIKTGSRLVEVQRLRDGLATILLPEGSSKVPTPWLKATKAMTPALNRRTHFFYAASVVFGSGFVAMLAAGLLYRLQPIDSAPVAKPQVISASNLPRTQWLKISNVPAGSYVKAIRFKNGRWESPELGSAEAAAAAPSPSTDPVSQ